MESKYSCILVRDGCRASEAGASRVNGPRYDAVSALYDVGFAKLGPYGAPWKDVVKRGRIRRSKVICIWSVVDAFRFGAVLRGYARIRCYLWLFGV